VCDAKDGTVSYTSSSEEGEEITSKWKQARTKIDWSPLYTPDNPIVKESSNEMKVTPVVVSPFPDELDYIDLFNPSFWVEDEDIEDDGPWER